MSKGFGKSKLERNGVSAKKFAMLLAMAVKKPDEYTTDGGTYARRYATNVLSRYMMPAAVERAIESESEEELRKLIYAGLLAK